MPVGGVREAPRDEGVVLLVVDVARLLLAFVATAHGVLAAVHAVAVVVDQLLSERAVLEMDEDLELKDHSFLDVWTLLVKEWRLS